MYKKIDFFSSGEMLDWLNQNKSIEVISIIDVDTHIYIVYYEPEPQPQQKDLIPESDKKQNNEY